MDPKCLFCNLAANKVPAFKVYEDEKFIAFLDINPLNKGHTLVIPKEHHIRVYDVPEFGDYWEIAQRVAHAQLKVLDATMVQFITVGLHVPHAHIHVVPRYENDGHGTHLDPSKAQPASESELKETAEKLKNAMPVESPKTKEPEPDVEEKEDEYTDEQLELFRRDSEQA